MAKWGEKIKLTVPSKWLVLFTLAVLIPCAILVLLGLQALRDESLIVEKKLEQEDLRRAAVLQDAVDEVILGAEEKLLQSIRSVQRGGDDLGSLARDLARLGRGEGVIRHFFVIDSGGKAILPAVRPLYVEGEREIEPVSEGRSLKEARAIELRERDYQRAVEAFEKVFKESEAPREKAESLLGAARCRLKSADPEKAIASYEKLAEQYPTLQNSAGFPYALVARYEKGRALAQLSRHDEALEEIVRAYKDLAGPTWELTRDQYVYLSDLLKGQAESLVPSSSSREARSTYARLASREAEELDLTRIKHSLERYFPGGTVLEASATGATEVVAGADETLVYVAAEEGGAGAQVGMAGFIIYHDDLLTKLVSPQLAKLASGEDVVVAVVDDAGDVVAAGGALPERGPATTQSLGRYLPGWSMQVYYTRPESYTRMVTLRRRIYAALLAPLFLVILLGLFLLGAGLTKEMRLARMKADFISTVSHELKSPLTSIRMFGEMLQMGRVASPGQRKKYYELITSESNRLQQLIDNILDFSRMEEGKKEYRFGKCDLRKIVTETVEAYQYAVSNNGYQITVKEDDRLPEIEMDKDAISQAVLNLLSNAVKFSNEDKKIDVRLIRRDRDAVIEVEDRGMGIGEEEIGRIFEKFYRSGDVLTRATRGTGLGLTIVQHIAQSHGGRVEVRSTKGVGSTFSIILPIGGRDDAENIDSRR